MKKLDDRGLERITWGEVYRDIKEQRKTESWFQMMIFMIKVIAGIVLIALLFYLTSAPSQAQTFDSEYVDVFYRAGSTKAVYRIQFNDGKDEILKDQSGEPVKTFIVAQEILNGNGYEFVFTYQAFPIHVGVKAEDTHFIFRKVKF